MTKLQSKYKHVHIGSLLGSGHNTLRFLSGWTTFSWTFCWYEEECHISNPVSSMEKKKVCEQRSTLSIIYNQCAVFDSAHRATNVTLVTDLQGVILLPITASVLLWYPTLSTGYHSIALTQYNMKYFHGVNIQIFITWAWCLEQTGGRTKRLGLFQHPHAHRLCQERRGSWLGIASTLPWGRNREQTWLVDYIKGNHAGWRGARNTGIASDGWKESARAQQLIDLNRVQRASQPKTTGVKQRQHELRMH